MTNQFPLIMIAIKVLKTESAIINVTLLEFVHSFKNFGHFYFSLFHFLKTSNLTTLLYLVIRC